MCFVQKGGKGWRSPPSNLSILHIMEEMCSLAKIDVDLSVSSSVWS